MNIHVTSVSTLWSVRVTIPPKTPLPDGFIPAGYYSAGHWDKASAGCMNVHMNVVADTFEEAMERTRNILPMCSFVTVSKGNQIHLP